MDTHQLTTQQRPWTRSDDGLVAGVCQGLAERFNVDPWLLRILLLVAVFAFGTGILAYLILALTLPRESEAKLMQPRKRLLGVCLRLSEQTGIDLGLMRALTAFSAIMSFGVTAVAYIGLHFVLESRNTHRRDVVI